MKRTNLTLWSAVLVLAIAFATMSLASPGPSKDTLDITAMTSSGSAGSVSPILAAVGPKQEWFYAFNLTAGSSLNQVIPVQYQFNNTDGDLVAGTNTATVSFNPVAPLAGSVFAADAATPLGSYTFTITDNGVAQIRNIVISTGPLAAGDYITNIHIAGSPANQVELHHDTIHVMVHVNGDPPASCFLTSSDFDLLQDCAGNAVATSSGGTFAIVGNSRGRVVSTNPGQFYYNLVWMNTGATQPVTINLSASNLVSQGANAVHAFVFDSSGFVADATNFDMVNQDGTPCGPNGPCTVTVAAGKTLWVTWHLSYAGIGGPLPAPSTCPGNVSVSATGILKDSNGATLATCQASATGYLKSK